MKTILFVLCAVSLASAGATQARAANRDHEITADDYFSLAHITEVATSPDGKQVVYGEMRWERKRELRNIDLWLSQGPGRPRTRLTFDSAADRSPSWSPDGRWIYFLSSRSKPLPSHIAHTQQIWRIRPDGTQLTLVSRHVGGVERYALSMDGRRVVFTSASDQVKPGPFKKLRTQYSKLRYGQGKLRASELWSLDLVEWRETKLSKHADRFIRSFALSPDGARVFALTAPTRRLIDNEGWSHAEWMEVSKGDWHRLKDDLWRAKAPSPYGWLSDPGFSPDGRKVSFRVSFDGYPSELVVVNLSGPKPAPRTLSRKWKGSEVTLSGPAMWVPGAKLGRSRLCVKAIFRARHGVYCWDGVHDGKQSAVRSLTQASQGNVYAYGFSRNGKALAVVMSDVTHPPDVFVLPASGGARYARWTRVNPQVDRWKLPQIRAVRWKSADGTPVEGILELPHGYKGGALPLVVELHGGPTSATALELRFWIYGRTLFAARGWALLSPNYRGSTGYGDRFLTELIGHKNDRDVADILAGVDHLVAQGVADKDKLAVMGWSNGGYLTNCLITRTTRFKAASSGAGVFDTTMQWMIEDTPGHVINYSQGQPWQAGEKMRMTSPLYGVAKVKTPTLIHVGEHDPRVPVQHSRALFRSLHQYLQVPTQLIEYPRTGHGLREWTHRKAKMAWDIAWLDRWVLGKDRLPAKGSSPMKKP